MILDRFGGGAEGENGCIAWTDICDDKNLYNIYPHLLTNVLKLLYPLHLSNGEMKTRYKNIL